MKKGMIAFLGIAVVALVAFLALSPSGLGLTAGAASSGTPAAAATLAPVKATGQVNVEGKLVPYQYVDLSFNTTGTVETVLVSEGQAVKAGDLLARLHNQEQIKVSIASAELDVANAEKALDDLYVNAPLQAAQTWSDMVQAEKTLEDAQKKRSALNYPRGSEELIKEAQQTYDTALDGYNKMKDYYDRANELDKRNLLDRVQKLRKERDDALAQLNYYKGKPDQFNFDQADATLALAQTNLSDLQRKYTILKDGPDPEDVKIAQAQVAQAQAKAEAAQASLKDLELRAPFDGTLVSMSLKPGQSVTQGTLAATLADFSKWRVETTNLTELSVLKIQVGSPAVVSFDALPGVSFNGKVATIQSLGQNLQGDITYTASIDLDKIDPRLRWNMTAPVAIKTQ
jgi:multidrug resistance efflux pump